MRVDTVLVPVHVDLSNVYKILEQNRRWKTRITLVLKAFATAINMSS